MLATLTKRLAAVSAILTPVCPGHATSALQNLCPQNLTTDEKNLTDVLCLRPQRDDSFGGKQSHNQKKMG